MVSDAPGLNAQSAVVDDVARSMAGTKNSHAPKGDIAIDAKSRKAFQREQALNYLRMLIHGKGKLQGEDGAAYDALAFFCDSEQAAGDAMIAMETILKEEATRVFAEAQGNPELRQEVMTDLGMPHRENAVGIRYLTEADVTKWILGRANIYFCYQAKNDLNWVKRDW